MTYNVSGGMLNLTQSNSATIWPTIWLLGCTCYHMLTRVIIAYDQRLSRFLHFIECLLIVIVWSICRCSGTESVTALMCSGQNRTEPDTGYSHLLACSSVTYRGRNAAHIHLPFSIDQTLKPTMMSVVCSIVILYAKYLAKMLCMTWCRNKKCSRPN